MSVFLQLRNIQRTKIFLIFHVFIICFLTAKWNPPAGGSAKPIAIRRLAYSVGEIISSWLFLGLI